MLNQVANENKIAVKHDAYANFGQWRDNFWCKILKRMKTAPSQKIYDRKENV